MVKFQKIFDETDISYTNFIRTTSKEHQNIAQDFWVILIDHLVKINIIIGFVYQNRENIFRD